jgi:hypothetical protein
MALTPGGWGGGGWGGAADVGVVRAGTVCNDATLHNKRGRFQCVRAIAQKVSERPAGRVKRFAVGESRVAAPGGQPDAKWHRLMINMDGSSRDMSYDGWQHRLEFFAFTDETPGTECFTIGQAWDPHRALIEYGLPAGWTLLSSFYAYTTKHPRTARFCVGEAFDPHRVMIFLDEQFEYTGRDMEVPGWAHKFHFYAYPDTKSHVAALAQARSALWGLPHLAGLQQRAFWSWLTYARNSRIVEQNGRREGLLQKMESEIAGHRSKAERLEVSHFCVCIGSLCLRQWVHGASIGAAAQARADAGRRRSAPARRDAGCRERAVPAP